MNKKKALPVVLKLTVKVKGKEELINNESKLLKKT